MKYKQSIVVSAAIAIAVQNAVNAYCDTIITVNGFDLEMKNRIRAYEMQKDIVKDNFDAEFHASMMKSNQDSHDRSCAIFTGIKSAMDTAHFPFRKEVKTAGMSYVWTMDFAQDMSEVEITYSADIQDDQVLAMLELLPELTAFITKVYRTSFQEVPYQAIDKFVQKLSAIHKEMDSDEPINVQGEALQA